MKNKIKLTLLILLAISGCSPDFDEGQKAYDSKDYQSALMIWGPLARDGHVEAQLKLERVLPRLSGHIQKGR